MITPTHNYHFVFKNPALIKSFDEIYLQGCLTPKKTMGFLRFFKLFKLNILLYFFHF